jgi:hypothetical protein
MFVDKASTELNLLGAHLDHSSNCNIAVTKFGKVVLIILVIVKREMGDEPTFWNDMMMEHATNMQNCAKSDDVFVCWSFVLCFLLLLLLNERTA